MSQPEKLPTRRQPDESGPAMNGNPEAQRDNPGLDWLIVVLLLAIAAVMLYRSAYAASDLRPVPDAVEYALGANRFVAEGHYEIVIQGQHLPSRYPPWFSVFVLAPAYAVLGLEPGNAIYPVILFGAVGLVIAFFLAKAISGSKGGVVAALAVLSLPVFRYWSRLVMSDVPCTVLILIICLIYLRIRASQERKHGLFLLAGVLIAFATLIRPVSAAAVLPFLLVAMTGARDRSRWSLATCLIAPLGAAAIMTFVYNAHTFGSATRNGYQFWCPVPYDYRSLTFSTSYLTANLKALWSSWLPLVVVGLIIAFAINNRRRNQQSASEARRLRVRGLVEFLLLATGPAVLFHLVYFYPDPRFFLPALCLSTILLAAIICDWLPVVPRYVPLVISIVALLLVFSWRCTVSESPPYRRLAAIGSCRTRPITR